MKGSSAMRLAWYYIKKGEATISKEKRPLDGGNRFGYNLYEKQISNKDWWFSYEWFRNNSEKPD